MDFSAISPVHSALYHSRMERRAQSSLPNYYFNMNLMVPAPSFIKNSPLTNAVSNLKLLFNDRNVERMQLSSLNDRFASYIERIRFLEVQNRLLEIEHHSLLSKLNKPHRSTSELYENEIKEASKLIDDIQRETDVLGEKVSEAESHVEFLQSRIVDINSNEIREKIIENERETAENHMKIFILDRRLRDMEFETGRFKNEINRTADDINRLSMELQREILLKNSMQLKRSMVENEIELEKEMHKEQISDLKNELTLMRTYDPTGFFRNGLADAVQSIRQEYKVLNEKLQADLQNRYALICTELALAPCNDYALSPFMTRHKSSQELKMKEMLEKSLNGIHQLSLNNSELKGRIEKMSNQIDSGRRLFEGILDAKDAEIEAMRNKLNKLTSRYDDVIHTRVSLESEIQRYKELLDGTSDRDGLRHIVEKITRNRGSIRLPSIHDRDSYRTTTNNPNLPSATPAVGMGEKSRQTSYLQGFRSYVSHDSDH